MNATQRPCFHCNLPVPEGTKFSVIIEGQERAMCCPGCQAVAQAIVDNGLTDFYKYRTEKNYQGQALIPDELDKLSVYDNPAIQQKFVSSDASQIKSTTLILEGIVCAACVWLSEHHVNQLPGVKKFLVNYTTHRAQLEWDDSAIQLSQILIAIRDIGYLAHPLDAKRQEEVYKKERSQAIRRIAVAGLGAMQVMMLAVALYAGDYEGMDSNLQHFLRWISLLITTPVLLYSAKPFFVAARRDLKMRYLGMDVPVALAIAAAYFASLWATLSNTGEVYFDSVTMFTFFLLSGRFLELTVRQKAGRAAEELVKLIPAMATRIDAHENTIVPVSDLVVGDRILVKPGESIPADGTVLQGSSSVDESLLTGESMPVRCQLDDSVIAGSVNIESAIELRVNALGEQTVLASIQRLLERAQAEKPRLAILANKVASYFVAALLLIAMSVGVYWLYVDSSRAFWIVISVLVVTCPCALSLATPTALTAAIGRLTRFGMLTTKSHALETLAKIDTVIFDKTGTLTEGNLTLESVTIHAHVNEQQCRQIAAALEQYSEHPIAKCLSTHVVQDKNLKAYDVENVPGMGLQGTLDGAIYFIGSDRFVAKHCKQAPRPAKAQNAFVSARVYLADTQNILAEFSFTDPIRASAPRAIQRLKDMGITSMMLSGDQAASVASVAKQLHIDHATGGLDPEQKLQKLSELQAQGHILAMVGDGVNDAPVLSRAQVSIAMGQGTQIAQASADMILLSDDLSHIADSIQVSHATNTVIRQNLIWAIMYNAIALPLAAAGLVAPWMAAIGMSSSSLVVVLNALRLTRQAPVMTEKHTL